MVETLSALSASDRREWTTGALGVLVLTGLAFYLESRFFKRSRRVGSWLVLRTVSLLAAPLTVAVVFGAGRSVSGMEGLAVFYLALFTAGPLLWFGSHLLCGPRLRPALTSGESLVLALTGIAILAIPATAFVAAQAPLAAAARDLASHPQAASGAPPLAHQVHAPQRFEFPGAGVVFTQSLTAPAGIRLERVDQRQGGPWYDSRGVAHPLFCTHGSDLHLMWSAREPAPQLRLHWTQPDGQRMKAEFFPDLATLAPDNPRAFSVGFRPDGFDPVVPVPRVRAHLGILRQDGTMYTHTLNPLQAGETMDNNCLMPGYQRVDWRNEGQVQTIGIMFYLPGGAPPLRAEIRRPDRGAPVPALENKPP